jgi:hypothetical protein
MRLLVLLYAHPGNEVALRVFEDRALAILRDYASVERHHSPTVLGDTTTPTPDEVHLLNFPDERAFENYRNDPRIQALLQERAAAVRDSVILRLT